MTENQIANTIEAFAQVAADAMALGFDTVEIHGAHGYSKCDGPSWFTAVFFLMLAKIMVEATHEVFQPFAHRYVCARRPNRSLFDSDRQFASRE